MRQLPPAALLDTSVLLRFFRDHGDTEQAAADAILAAWRADSMQLVLLDLSVYELVNIAVRRLGLDSSHATGIVTDLFRFRMPIVSVDAALGRATAEIAAESGLSGYDAAFLAAARRSGVALVTGDRRLAGETGAIALDELGT
ncbi:MAG: type II toxin-antitoxin system VapC family toxin [Acidimicrobiia bacterium]